MLTGWLVDQAEDLFLGASLVGAEDPSDPYADSVRAPLPHNAPCPMPSRHMSFSIFKGARHFFMWMQLPIQVPRKCISQFSETEFFR